MFRFIINLQKRKIMKKKIIISLAAGAICVICSQRSFDFNLFSVIATLISGLVIYGLFFRVMPEMDKVEILEEYKREPEDPEDILP